MLLGAHLSIAEGIKGLKEQIQTLKINTLQLFLSSPTNWKNSNLNEKDIDEFRNLKKTIEITAVHAPYVVNLASLSTKLRNISIHKVINELKLANQMGIDYYVLHPGSPKSEDFKAGINNLSTSINKILSKIPDTSTKILIEWSAGEGFEIGKNLEEIALILENISDKEKIGICLDTCHLFTSGIDISSSNTFEQFKELLQKRSLITSIKLIHCNDSKAKLGQRKDRHQHIGQGFIGIEGFRNFTKDNYFSQLPFIIETPKENNMDTTNLKILKELF